VSAHIPENLSYSQEAEKVENRRTKTRKEFNNISVYINKFPDFGETKKTEYTFRKILHIFRRIREESAEYYNTF